MDVKDLARAAPVALDEDELFALRQLCSTAWLAAGRLDEEACVRLLRARLVFQDEHGYWGVTPAGKKAFDALEPERLRR